MHHGVIFLLCLLLATITVRADEKLSTLKAGNVIYTNVTVMSVTEKNVTFTYAQGMASVKLQDLEPAMQKHFGYEPAKVAAEQTNAPAAAVTLTAIGAGNKIPDNANPKAVMDAAIARVKAIVNQPVTALPYTRDMERVGTFPYWFHPGANTPDYDTVDVRKTQDTSNYATNKYITSDMNPGVVFRGDEVEFNSMTKYFYTDRSVPKKKLTEAEMLEINRLYRIIGQCETKLDPQKAHEQKMEAVAGFLLKNRAMFIGVTAGLLVLLVIVRRVMNRT
jgi:hypothetical protein